MKPPATLADLPVYAINLDSRPDRWQRLARQMAAVQLPAPRRWPAIDGRATTTADELAAYRGRNPVTAHVGAAIIGHCKTFLALLTHLMRAPAPWTLILEDDAEFVPDIHSRYEQFAALVPGDALILALGAVHFQQPAPLPGTGRLAWLATWITASHGFLVHADALQLLHDAAWPPIEPFDNSWNSVHALGRTYCPSPHLITQGDGYSTIRDCVRTITPNTSAPPRCPAPRQLCSRRPASAPGEG